VVVVVVRVVAGPPKMGLGPSEKFFAPPSPSKGRLAKNFYTKLERLTLIFKVTRAWSE